MTKNSINKPWYKKWWGIVLTILFFPVVLPVLIPYIVWTKTTFHRGIKITVSILGALLLIGIVNSQGAQKNTQIEQNTTVEKIVEKVEKTTEEIAMETKEKARMEKVKALEKKEIEAEVYTKHIVSEMLTSPSTAKFKMDSRIEVNTDNNTENIVVWGYVDSQNSFGAMLRTDFNAKLDYSNGKGGEIIYLKVGDKVIK